MVAAPARGIAAEKAQVTRSEETHERRGWYLSAALGGGALAGSSIHRDGDSRSAGLSGGAFAMDLAVGRALGPSLVLGADLYVTGLVGPSASFPSGASLSTGSVSLIGIGPFVDYYFDPSKGWHIQASAGYALMMGPSSCTDYGQCTRSNDLFEDMSGSAVTVAGGIGHDWWVGPGFSLGLLARGGYITGSMSNPANFKLNVEAPVLALQLTGTLGR
jgi:hypothetical protein